MEKPDAGLRSLDHYKQRLPWWRYYPRERLIPLVRRETPHLARLQSLLRSPALDSYFAITANLGTHTFFMVFLPILFWCGYTSLGRGMVHILASGVFLSGFVKDLLCLPRPLSPPLQRITMSGSAALEYGFPSTHSTNAVSVAVYALFLLNSPEQSISPAFNIFLRVLACSYAFSIILGRLYCGMHGFFDVTIGSALGAALSVVECLYGSVFDDFIYEGSFQSLSIVILIVLVLVRVHPEPADDCPCFDDSVAFAGVLCGVELGNWHFAQTRFSWSDPVPGTVPYSLEILGWPTTIARIVIGVLCIFGWRGVMKPALLKGLPPIFRIVERLGLSIPRRFFTPASQYKRVPSHLNLDTVMPSVSELPQLISSIRHPRKHRSVSVGPQSEADAYEALAFRAKLRQESASPTSSASIAESTSATYRKPKSRSFSNPILPSEPPTPAFSNGDLPQSPQGTATTVEKALGQEALNPSSNSATRSPSQDRRIEEKATKQIFSQLEKPRVRYDVEVITKIIVYSGIGWLAVEGNPILFELLSLGVNSPVYKKP